MTEFLLKFAKKQGFNVKYKPLQANDGRIKGNHIAIREGLSEEYQAHIIAHELAHAYIHGGNTINNLIYRLREEQAERAATLILELLKFTEEEKKQGNGQRN